MRSRSLDLNSEKTGIREVGVDGRCTIDEVVLLHKVSDGSAVHSLSWSAGREGGGGSDKLIHHVVCVQIRRAPWAGLKAESDGGSWSLGPFSVFTANVLSWGSLELMLWNWIKVTESFLDEINVFFVVLDTTCNDEAFSWGDVIHDELLQKSGINVVDILLETKTRHSKSVETISGSQKELLIFSEWVVLGQMIEKVVRFLVL